MDETAVEVNLAALERRIAALEDENAFYKRWCAARRQWDDATWAVMDGADDPVTATGRVS